LDRLLIIGALFVLAGLCEIGGGYLVWGWIREGRPLAWAALGAAILALYGVVAALQPISEFGRVYAAYGGIFIALALLWGIVVDGFRPDRWDLLGATIAVARGRRGDGRPAEGRIDDPQVRTDVFRRASGLRGRRGRPAGGVRQGGIEAEVEVEVVAVNTEEEARQLRFPGSPTIREGGRDLFPTPEREDWRLGCRRRSSPTRGPSSMRTKGLMRRAYWLLEGS
jgi:small multidrug resistance family-3 protein